MKSWTSDRLDFLDIYFGEYLDVEENIEVVDLYLFPNPIKGHSISLSNIKQLRGDYVIFNNEGKAKINGILYGISEQEININELIPGIYFMQVNTKLGSRNMKIVVL